MEKKSGNCHQDIVRSFPDLPIPYFQKKIVTFTLPFSFFPYEKTSPLSKKKGNIKFCYVNIKVLSLQ